MSLGEGRPVVGISSAKRSITLLELILNPERKLSPVEYLMAGATVLTSWAAAKLLCAMLLPEAIRKAGGCLASVNFLVENSI